MAKTQSDLFAQPPAEKGRHIYRVSEIIQDIRIILENTFAQVWVEGEISNFQTASSGHCYFTLKDDSAVLPAAMFSRVSKGIKFKVENGLKVICFGKISVYGPRGQYQIIVEDLEPKGIGSLQLALEQLKKKLEKEGLFSPEHKRPIPYLPSRIGVITSLQGAAIRDILKVLERRFSDVHVIINPVQVQGDSAKKEIVQAIKDFNRFNEDSPEENRIEVMIVGRGGGSIEDLWAFNEEEVCRAIYNSKIPVISAVGHERDFTVADLAADLRAATPSVAAEIVMPKKDDLKEKTRELLQSLSATFLGIISNFEQTRDDFMRRLRLGIENIFRLSTSDFETARKKLILLNPAAVIQQYTATVADLARQMRVRLEHLLRLRSAEFNTAVGKLSSLSPLNILRRGYSITFKIPEGLILKDEKFIKIGDTIKTRLHRGEVFSQVTEVIKNGGD